MINATRSLPWSIEYRPTRLLAVSIPGGCWSTVRNGEGVQGDANGLKLQSHWLHVFPLGVADASSRDVDCLAFADHGTQWLVLEKVHFYPSLAIS